MTEFLNNRVSISVGNKDAEAHVKSENLHDTSPATEKIVDTTEAPDLSGSLSRMHLKNLCTSSDYEDHAAEGHVPSEGVSDGVNGKDFNMFDIEDHVGIEVLGQLAQQSPRKSLALGRSHSFSGKTENPLKRKQRTRRSASFHQEDSDLEFVPEQSVKSKKKTRAAPSSPVLPLGPVKKRKYTSHREPVVLSALEDRRSGNYSDAQAKALKSQSENTFYFRFNR